MGNVSVKNKRNRKRIHTHTHRCRHKLGGMHSPQKEEASPRTIIRQKMRANVTRRQKEAKANSDSPFGSPMLTKTRTRRKKTPPKETIIEE